MFQKLKVYSHTSFSVRQAIRLFAFMIIVGPVSARADVRTWTSSDGKTQVVGELLGISNKDVILKKQQDGRIYLVPYSMLSHADQTIVQQKFPASFTAQKNATASGRSKSNMGNPTAEKTTIEDTKKGQALDWKSVSKAFPAFRPFTVNGVPAYGKASYQMTRQQSDEYTKLDDQLGCLFSMFASPASTRNLAKRLKTIGWRASTESIGNEELTRIADYSLFMESMNAFNTQEDYRAFNKHYNSAANDFDKGEILAKYAEQIATSFDKIKFTDGKVPIGLLQNINVGDYDIEVGAFPLNHHFPKSVGSITSYVELVYLNAPDIPLQLKMNLNEARNFSRNLAGKDVIIQNDLILSNFRWTQNRFGSWDKQANAKLVRVSLVDREDPRNVLYTWNFQTPADATVSNDASSKGSDQKADSLTRKMESIARAAQLKTWQSYPIIRDDYEGSKNKNDPQVKRFWKMLDRVALGLKSDFLNPNLVANHFPETIGKYVTANQGFRGVTSANWHGVSEFEKRDAEARFRRDYSEKLKNLVIELPIRFTEVTRIILGDHGRYDFERRGFVVNHDFQRFAPKLFSPPNPYFSGEIPRLNRPGYIQSFVPYEMEKARTLFNKPDGVAVYGYLTRSVTWNRLNLELKDSTRMPAVSASYSDYEIYADAELKQQIVKLESYQVPESAFCASVSPVLPDASQPLPIDYFTLTMLQHEATKQIATGKDLIELMQAYAPHEQKLRRQQISHADAYSRLDNELVRHSPVRTAQQRQKKLEVIENWERLKPLVISQYQAATSTFFPYGMGTDVFSEKSQNVIAEQWYQWMQKCIKSTDRHFVLNLNLKVDPDVKDMQLLTINRMNTDSHTWKLSGDVLKNGISSDRFIVFKTNDHRLKFTPALRLSQSVQKVLQKVPDSVRETIAQLNGNDAEVECIVKIESATFHKQAAYHSDLLVLNSTVTELRILDNGALLHRIKLAPSVQVSNLKREVPPSAQLPEESLPNLEEAGVSVPLTPAVTERLIAKYLPTFSNKYAVQLMVNRWKQETDYRSQRENSAYGVDPQLGMYFPANTRMPEVRRLAMESDQFLRWMQDSNKRLKKRFTLRMKARFHALDKKLKGYPLARINRGGFDDLNRLTKVSNQIRAEVNRVDRRIKTEARMKEFEAQLKKDRLQASSGVSIAQPPAETQSSASLETEKLKHALNVLETASPYLRLSSVNGIFRLADLDGNVQREQTSQSQTIQSPNGTRTWNPDDVRSSIPHVPISPVLVMNRKICLPKLLQIEPGSLNFEIEIDFQISKVEELDQLPSEYGKNVDAKYRDQLQPADLGHYVLFYVELENAWLLHPKTKQRLHQLTLSKKEEA